MTDFPRLLAALSDVHVEFIIVGGLAATIHDGSRLTQHIDVVYHRSDENLDGSSQPWHHTGRTCAAHLGAFPSNGPGAH